MKLFKRISIFIIILMLINLFNNIQNDSFRNSVKATSNPPKVGVLLFDAKDRFLSLIRERLENIQKENPDTINFSFYDAKSNQSIQNETIDSLIRSNIDLLLINLVDVRKENMSDIIEKARISNIPIIFFNIELPIDSSNTYEKALVVGTDSKVSGVMQGQILANLWKSNRKAIDKNKDKTLQYVILEGSTSNESAINRTQLSISTINNNGIQTKELARKVCNWQRPCAKEAMNLLFLSYADRIEAVIANNDDMAVGAIEALQAYGYNKGDKTKNITVIGVDAIPEARELIDKGLMAGTVVQDTNAYSKALYSLGLNLIYNRVPTEGTNYKIEPGKIVRLPYYEYNPQKNLS